MLLLGLVAPLLVMLSSNGCSPMVTTAYDRYGFSPRFADGTSVYTGEPVVAASTDIRMGSTVWIEGLGTFVVRDRGDLGGDGWLDIAMESYWAAKQYGHQIRMVCVAPPW